MVGRDDGSALLRQVDVREVAGGTPGIARDRARCLNSARSLDVAHGVSIEEWGKTFVDVSALSTVAISGRNVAAYQIELPGCALVGQSSEGWLINNSTRT